MLFPLLTVFWDSVVIILCPSPKHRRVARRDTSFPTPLVLLWASRAISSSGGSPGRRGPVDRGQDARGTVGFKRCLVEGDQRHPTRRTSRHLFDKLEEARFGKTISGNEAEILRLAALF